MKCLLLLFLLLCSASLGSAAAADSPDYLQNFFVPAAAFADGNGCPPPPAELVRNNDTGMFPDGSFGCIGSLEERRPGIDGGHNYTQFCRSKCPDHLAYLVHLTDAEVQKLTLCQGLLYPDGQCTHQVILQQDEQGDDVILGRCQCGRPLVRCNSTSVSTLVTDIQKDQCPSLFDLMRRVTMDENMEHAFPSGGPLGVEHWALLHLVTAFSSVTPSNIRDELTAWIQHACSGDNNAVDPIVLQMGTWFPRVAPIANRKGLAVGKSAPLPLPAPMPFPPGSSSVASTATSDAVSNSRESTTSSSLSSIAPSSVSTATLTDNGSSTLTKSASEPASNSRPSTFTTSTLQSMSTQQGESQHSLSSPPGPSESAKPTDSPPPSPPPPVPTPPGIPPPDTPDPTTPIVLSVSPLTPSQDTSRPTMSSPSSAPKPTTMTITNTGSGSATSFTSFPTSSILPSLTATASEDDSDATTITNLMYNAT